MDKITENLYTQLVAQERVKNFRSKPEDLNLKNFSTLSIERNNQLKNAYYGINAVILTCGPSLSEVWDNKLNDFLKTQLVVSVKQAHFNDPELSDFHLYNEVRMENYEYPSTTIKLSVSKFLKNNPSHIHYPIYNYKYKDALFVSNKYDDWSLENSFVRPWGVGIMFELGLFLPIYLGCKRVVIIGFDMNSHGKFHFYDNRSDKDSKFYRVDEEEFEYINTSLPYYVKWTRQRGVDVKLYSPLSELPIPKINNIYKYLE